MRTPQGNFDVMNAAPHLLIVDDDKELCALLSKFLSRHGYRVSIAHNGSQMAAILEGSRVSLVLLDLLLPGEDDGVMPPVSCHQYTADHHADGEGRRGRSDHRPGNGRG